MLVMFRSNHDERLINTDSINAIFQNKDSKEPYFYVEYSHGSFGFNVLNWNGFFRGCVTLEDVFLAFRYFEKMEKDGVK